MTPEQKARQEIDRPLAACGWLVQSKNEINITASPGVAIREFALKTDHADYLPYADGKAIGVIEAKPEGYSLTGVEIQSAKYTDDLSHYHVPLPFAYESTGSCTQFTNELNPFPRSREVFTFHRPEELIRLATAGRQLRAALREMPEVNTESLDFLLADFNAIKAEIGRRSNLQRIVLAAYVGMVALVFQQAVSGPLPPLSITGLWLAEALVLLFHRRESFGIRRLGRLIEERVARQAASLMNVPAKELLPSQVNASMPEINKLTRRYPVVFEWAVFLGLPAELSGLKFFHSLEHVDRLWTFKTSTPLYSLVGAIGAVSTLYLLWSPSESVPKRK